MVSASAGALLVPHLPAGQLRLTMLLACYGMFGLSLIASLVVITQLWRRLVRYSAGPAAMVYLALVAAWAVVSVRTARGAWRGRLFLATPPHAPPTKGNPP